MTSLSRILLPELEKIDGDWWTRMVARWNNWRCWLRTMVIYFSDRPKADISQINQRTEWINCVCLCTYSIFMLFDVMLTAALYLCIVPFCRSILTMPQQKHYLPTDINRDNNQMPLIRSATSRTITNAHCSRATTAGAQDTWNYQSLC